MSAAEIIELIEKLPPTEKAEVLAHLEKARTGREIRYLPQAEAEQIADKIFKDHAELFRKLAQ